MPMMGQMVNYDYDAVVKDPYITPYQHAAAEKCLKSQAHVSDPVATLQIMGMVATEGLKALRKRWTGVDAWLLGDDKATPPSFETHHVKWYDASEANRKYAAPATEWPGADRKKMKPKKSRSGKRKKKDAQPPVPLSRFFGTAPPKRSRVEALDELD